LKLEEDRKNNHPIAVLLEGKSHRKIIKHTIMTSVYGVTFVGARRQIENALIDKYPNFPDKSVLDATVYLTKKTFEALNNLFSGAKAIMDWLVKCASIICKNGENLTWVTPLGLPVVQPYRKAKSNEFVTSISQEIVLKEIEKLGVNPRRNATAFPPNFVHSLDSTHMFLTAIECQRLGITFASVHDSFWTHACTVPYMNKILREQFVEIYKRPLLDDLRKFWLAEYPNISLPPVPAFRGLDVSKVLDSNYFFH